MFHHFSHSHAYESKESNGRFITCWLNNYGVSRCSGMATYLDNDDYLHILWVDACFKSEEGSGVNGNRIH